MNECARAVVTCLCRSFAWTASNMRVEQRVCWMLAASTALCGEVLMYILSRKSTEARMHFACVGLTTEHLCGMLAGPQHHVSTFLVWIL